MKMLSYLAGELPNSATCFTTFANINQSEPMIIKRLLIFLQNIFGNHLHILKDLQMSLK